LFKTAAQSSPPKISVFICLSHHLNKEKAK